MKTNTQLLTLLPLELRSIRKGDLETVTNPKAHALWIGHILGDGYIHPQKGYLQIDQASEKLVKWFHIMLESFKMLPKNSQIQRVSRYDKRYNTTHTSYRFCTRAYKVDLWVKTFYRTTTRCYAPISA